MGKDTSGKTLEFNQNKLLILKFEETTPKHRGNIDKAAT